MIVELKRAKRNLELYRACDTCDEPMLGIMRISDFHGCTAPRSVCEPCCMEDDKKVA